MQSLTVAKEKETDPVRIQAIEKSLSESRIQLQQYHKGALYMRKVLMDSGRLTANATPVPSPRPPVAIVTDGSGASSQSQTSTNERTASPVPSKFINSGQQSSQNKLALPQPTPNATASVVNKKLLSPIPKEEAKPSTTTKASSTVKAPTSTPQGSSSNTTAKDHRFPQTPLPLPPQIS